MRPPWDSSRAPARGERIATPRTLAQVDLTAIMAALESAAAEPAPAPAHRDDRRIAALERQFAEARDCAAVLEQQNADLRRRLSGIAALAAGQAEEKRAPDINAAVPNQGMGLQSPPSACRRAGKTANPRTANRRSWREAAARAPSC